MLSKLHFVSGLPRSGSTLLCGLLRQNPRFSASVTSPVLLLCGTLLEKMCGAREFSPFLTNERRHRLLRSVFEAYYADAGDEQLVFDTNRLWTGRAALLKELYPEARIICCVREVSWIIDSLEQMLRRNPLELSQVFGFKPGNSVYSRADALMNGETGLVGLAWSSLREAWFSENARQLIVIKYESLVRQPEQTLRRLYEELQESWYPHDFEHVDYDEPDYDAMLGMPGLHKVHEKVAYRKRDSCIPPDIISKYANVNFWLRPDSNSRRVIVL